MANASVPPFQEMIDEHGSDVLGFLVASVGPSDAEDCFQETFIAALRAYPRLEHGRNLRSWLLTIAHRKAIDHHRGTARRPLPSGTSEEVAGDIAGSNHSGELPEEPGELWRLVSTLPAKQRSALVLRFAADVSYGRMGEILDCSEEAARQSVHAGLKKLRGVLA